MSIDKQLNICSKNQDCLGALSFYKPDLKIKHINMIIGILSNNMPIDLEIPHFSITQVKNHVVTNPKSNNITYECLIKLLCRLDKHQYLLDIMEHIENENIILKLRGYSPMIAYFIYHKQDYDKTFYIYDNFIKKQEIEITEKELTYLLDIDNDHYIDRIFGIIGDMSQYLYQFTEDLNQRIIDWGVSRKLRINNYHYDKYNGKCLENENYFLNELKLLDIDRNQILKQIINHHKTNKEFQSFIQKIKKKNIDVHIDGANIGYYNKRVDKGDKLSYHQIDVVLERCLSMGKKPLIYLHVRHYNNTNDYIKKWNKMKALYITPIGMDDDWFWLYGCLSKSYSSVITNDLMRDHHFTLLSKRRFIQWKERHCCSFDLTYPKNTLSKRFQKPNNSSIRYPLSYSNRIQYDTNNCIWYFPTDNDSHLIK